MNKAGRQFGCVSRKTTQNMRKEEKKLRKVSKNEVRNNIQLLLAAASEGRLFIASKPTAATRQEVVENVRRYVSQLDDCATTTYRGKMGMLWEGILGKDEFVDMLMPGNKLRKFRDFNKYGVMRIVGVLHAKGVYDEIFTDSVLCEKLEHTNGDNSYRSFLGRGLESRILLASLRDVISAI